MPRYSTVAHGTNEELMSSHSTIKDDEVSQQSNWPWSHRGTGPVKLEGDCGTTTTGHEIPRHSEFTSMLLNPARLLDNGVNVWGRSPKVVSA